MDHDETTPPRSGFLQWMSAPWKSDWPFKSAVLLILLVSITFRIFLISQSTWERTSDSKDYHEFAESLMRGEGYKQVYVGETSAYRGLTFYAYRMPGYPIVLAATYSIFGYHPQAAMAVNLLAEILSHLCLLALAFHLFGRAAALWGQGLWALHAFWTTSLMTESLFTAGFLVLAALLAHRSPFRSSAMALAYGTVACAITFLRPIGIVAYLSLGILMLATRLPFPRKVVLMLVAVLPTALCLSLWAYRNDRILGQPVFMTTQSGRVNAQEFGIGFEYVYNKLVPQGCNEAQINSHLNKAIMLKMRRAPSLYPRVYLHRLQSLLRLSPVQDSRLLHFNILFTGPRNSPWVFPLMSALYYQYYAVYLLAIFGILAMLRHKVRYQEIVTVLACFIFFHPAVSKTYIRYATPMFPLLLLCAAYALAYLTRTFATNLSIARQNWRPTV